MHPETESTAAHGRAEQTAPEVSHDDLERPVIHVRIEHERRIPGPVGLAVQHAVGAGLRDGQADVVGLARRRARAARTDR